ncbi:DUF1648 domain-containing protein [Virgibacillus halophilus]|uniref:DUF1648 domain-containing protein n=1 Tax=Tigheibacillus halophilus TaxID=361280 RepID=UPI0036F1D9EB
MGSHPKIEVKASFLEKVCHTLSVIFILVTSISAMHTYASVPAKVPIHFDSDHLPDGWGSSLYIFILPVAAVFIFIMFYFLGRKPHIHRYPVKVTAENAPVLYRLSRLMAAVMGVEITLLLAVITLEFGVETAGHPFSIVPVIISLILVAVSPILFIIAMWRRR